MYLERLEKCSKKNGKDTKDGRGLLIRHFPKKFFLVLDLFVQEV